MTGGTFLGEGLVATAQRRRAPVVTATHCLEVNLSVTAELASAQILSLILHDHLLEQVVLLVEVLLPDGLGASITTTRVVLLRHLIRACALHI